MSISIPVGFRPIGRPREREAARTRHGRAPALTLTGDSGRGTAGPPRSCCRCGLDCSGSGWEGAAARPTPSMDPCICDAASFVRCCSIGPGDLPGSLVAGGTYCCEAGSLLRPAAACPVSCPRAAPLLLLADSAAARWCPTAGESSVLGAILPFPPGCQTSWPDEHFESIWISTEQQGMGSLRSARTCFDSVRRLLRLLSLPAWPQVSNLAVQDLGCVDGEAKFNEVCDLQMYSSGCVTIGAERVTTFEQPHAILSRRLDASGTHRQPRATQVLRVQKPSRLEQPQPCGRVRAGPVQPACEL